MCKIPRKCRGSCCTWQWHDQGPQLQPQPVIHSVQPLQSGYWQVWRQRTNTMHRSEQHRKWRSQWQLGFQGSRRRTVPNRSTFPNSKTLNLLMNSFKVLTFLGTWRHGSAAKSACWESMRTWILVPSTQLRHQCPTDASSRASDTHPHAQTHINEYSKILTFHFLLSLDRNTPLRIRLKAHYFMSLLHSVAFTRNYSYPT